MKEILAVVLAAVLVLSLAGCGAAGAPRAETLAPEDPSVPPAVQREVTVHNVDELLDAIGSHVTVYLEPGLYDLSQARDYGISREDAPYTWERTYEGFQLVLSDLEDLELRGAGAEAVTVQTPDPYAGVLVLRNCDNATLEGMTLGHAPDQGECSGSVIVARSCIGLKIQGVGLFGCGVNGLLAEDCRELYLTDSRIYDCSNTAVTLMNCTGAELTDLEVTGIGTRLYGGYALYSLYSCQEVSITRCQASHSRVQYLVQSNNAWEVSLEEVAFREIRVSDSAFDLYLSDVILGECDFEDCNIRSWYPIHGIMARNARNEAMTEEMLEERYGLDQPQTPEEQQEIRAATVDEFLAAIGPNRKIILTGETYDLTTASDYRGNSSGEYYSWEEVYDGLCLVIWGVENLTITSESGDPSRCTILTQPRYADVITFLRCTGITLSGITLGHSQDAGYCMGNVVGLRDCDGITVKNCSLFGCGVVGVYAAYCGNLRVTECEIYDCSAEGILLESVILAEIEDCSFHDLGAADLRTDENCREITLNGNPA